MCLSLLRHPGGSSVERDVGRGVCTFKWPTNVDIVQRNADATKKVIQEVVAKNLLLPATLLGVAERIGGSNGLHSFGEPTMSRF